MTTTAGEYSGGTPASGATGCAAIIVAGGRGRRLFPGMPPRGKAGVAFHGRSFLAHVHAALRPAVDRVVIVAAAGIPLPDDVGAATVIHDSRPGDGPLAALADGLEWLAAVSATQRVVVAAVDLPRLSPAVPRWLLGRLDDRDAAGAAADWIVPLVDGHPQPLLSALCTRLRPRIDAYLATGRRDPRGLVDYLAGAHPGTVRLVPIAADAAALRPAFDDVDDPDDLERLAGPSPA